MPLVRSIADLVGSTPLAVLEKFSSAHGLRAELAAKLESFNPAGSAKDRIALAMILAAEEAGQLKPGGTIVELTSGNTGIGIAAHAAARGYRTIIVLPDDVSSERKLLIQAYGAEVVEINRKQYPTPSDRRQVPHSIASGIPGAVVLSQWENPRNPGVHFETTGPEIYADTDGRLDVLVASVGTGGTLSGAGAFLRSKLPDLRVVAVEPSWVSVPTPENPSPDQIDGIHRLTDVPDEDLPATFTRSVVDEFLEVDAETAYETARTLARTEVLLVGSSSGAALWGALQVSLRPENKGKRVVVVLSDTGERYLSSRLFA
ncbi:MAG: PLP-dependent cysteine synthase family protein [Pseudoclavibacter sp.]